MDLVFYCFAKLHIGTPFFARRFCQGQNVEVYRCGKFLAQENTAIFLIIQTFPLGFQSGKGKSLAQIGSTIQTSTKDTSLIGIFRLHVSTYCSVHLKYFTEFMGFLN